MAVTAKPARTYERLQQRILERTLELRASLDAGLARTDETAARAQISSMLDQLGTFLTTGDRALHRGYLQSLLAMRAAEAQSPSAVLGTLVAISDIATQVALETPGPEHAALALHLTRTIAASAKLFNDLLADELTSRLSERGRMISEAQEIQDDATVTNLSVEVPPASDATIEMPQMDPRELQDDRDEFPKRRDANEATKPRTGRR